MVLKSFAKINLSLNIIKKLKNGYHDIQSLYCLINLFDTISIKKFNNNKKKDKIIFRGEFSKFVKKSKNSIIKVLNILRNYKIISNFYLIKVNKKIPVFSGLGGGTSNAASVLNFLTRGKIKKIILNKIIEDVGSDLRLFLHDQGYLKNLKTVMNIRKKQKLNFLLAFPNIQCSTKEIYSKVKIYSQKKKIIPSNFNTKAKLIKTIVNSSNDLQLVVEKKYPIIKKLLDQINKSNGCILSRMTGSGSVCFGLYINHRCSKAALKTLRKKYPKFWFSIAKTI